VINEGGNCVLKGKRVKGELLQGVGKMVIRRVASMKRG